MKLEKTKINYLYFSLFFLFLALTIPFNSFLLEKANISHLFFFYSLGEITLEFIALITLAVFANHFFSKKFSFICMGFLTIALLLIHSLDFLLIRIFDLSFSQAFSLITQVNWDNFIEMLIATGIPLFLWALLLIFFLSLPFFGTLFYKFTHRLSCTYPLYFRPLFFSLLAIFLLFALIGSELFYSEALYSSAYSSSKVLPWKKTLLSSFFKKKKEKIFISQKPLQKFQESTLLIDTLRHLPPPPRPTGNIFLFILESVRKDFLDEMTTPHLATFAKENLSAPCSFASANATHISWFSLFHSRFPYLWPATSTPHPKGSLPLFLFKKAGFKIHLFTSSQLSYYNMEENLFGKNNSLCHSCHFFPHASIAKPPYQADQELIDSLLTFLSSCSSENNLFIIFLDSTHFGYSYPDPAPFLPAATSMTLGALYDLPSSIEKVKNRYRNALRYVDSLLGKLFLSLKEQNLFDSSTIVITSDHGEEFFERGHLFHGSNLSPMQVEVPIFYKFPKNNHRPFAEKNLFSHIDIFPTLLDYIFGKELFKNAFDGTSLFSQNRWPFALSARFNMKQTPYEFAFFNTTKSLLVQFSNKKEPLLSHELCLLSLRNREGYFLNESQEQIEKEFLPAFQRLFIPD